METRGRLQSIQESGESLSNEELLNTSTLSAEKEQSDADVKHKHKKKKSEKKNKFESNSKYYTISIYAIMTVLAGTIIFRIFFMWENTKVAIQGMINWGFPYIIGIFLACLLYPIVRFLETHILSFLPDSMLQFKRGLAILLTYILFLGIIGLAIGVILPQVWNSVSDLADSVPVWYNTLTSKVAELNKETSWDIAFVVQQLQDIGAYFGDKFDFGGKLDVESQLQNLALTVISTSVSVVSTSVSVVTVMFKTLISLIISLYILIDLKRIGRTAHKIIRAFVSEGMTEHITETAGECYDIFARFVSGKMVDSLIIGLLCFVAMNLLQLPYSVVISVVIGITNMIPYFGPFIGAVPGAFILLMVSPIKMAIYLVLVLVLQQFDGLYLGPKILGDSTGLRPAWIVFSVSAGGAVCGVLGMFLGVPAAAVIGHLIDLYIEWRLKRKNELEQEQREAEELELTDDN